MFKNEKGLQKRYLWYKLHAEPTVIYHLNANVFDSMQNNEKSRSIRFCMHKCM